MSRPDERALALRSDLGVSGEFAHGPHREVVCTTCHEDIQGHATHATVACADCHAAPAAESARALAEAECLACHHVEQTIRDCEGCHASAMLEPSVVNQTLGLSVANGAEARGLPFEHVVHDGLACSDCHAPNAEQSFATECGSCHEDHHAESRSCGACHYPEPLSAHDATAHLGCGGAGCHDLEAAPVPPSRARCLSCHWEQADHEPAGSCSTCHLLADLEPRVGLDAVEGEPW